MQENQSTAENAQLVGVGGAMWFRGWKYHKNGIEDYLLV